MRICKDEIRGAIRDMLKLCYAGDDMKSFLPLSPLGVAKPLHR